MLMWLLAERPDAAFPVKEVGRTAAGPMQYSQRQIKRLLKHLKQTSDLVLSLRLRDSAKLAGPDQVELHAIADVSWASGSGADRVHFRLLSPAGWSPDAQSFADAVDGEP